MKLPSELEVQMFGVGIIQSRVPEEDFFNFFFRGYIKQLRSTKIGVEDIVRRLSFQLELTVGF